jgi:hypothetical protein
MPAAILPSRFGWYEWVWSTSMASASIHSQTRPITWTAFSSGSGNRTGKPASWNSFRRASRPASSRCRFRQ